MLMLLILIFGYFGLINIKKTLFPERESRLIAIQVQYPGASPEEVEQGVVLKIEDNLKGLTGVERVSSTSSENTGRITVEVLRDYDTDIILQDVKNAVDRISSFPDGMEPPAIYKQENLSFVLNFSLSGDVDLRTLKAFGQKVESDLLALDGLTKVELSGFPDEEIEIALREEDMRRYGITFQQVTDAVRRENIDLTGGQVKGSREELLIRARSKVYYADELSNIIVLTRNEGTAVRLGDIATVRDIWADNPNRSYLNGKPSVIVTVQNTVNEDILALADKVKIYIQSFNEKNSVVKATLIRDGSKTLNQRIDLLVNNGIIGFLLVVILLAFFLHIRLAFWVAISIPVSFMGMFIMAAYIPTFTINVMSLFGMILVVGILVDDGIVIGENIYKQYEDGKPAMQAAIDGTLQVLPAVLSAVLTTIVAFSTFYFIDGRLGDFAPALGFVVIWTLIFSLLEGAFILPAHVAHSRALSPHATKNLVERTFDNIMRWLRENSYAPVLRFAIDHWFFTLSVSVALFMITLGAIGGGIVKLTFFPFIERDNINITLEMPAGTREQVTEDILMDMQRAVWQVSDSLRRTREDSLSVVENIVLSTGPGANIGNLDIRLLDNETRNIQSFVMSNLFREKVGVVPGADKVLYGISTPFGKPVSVSLLSNDLVELEAARTELKNELMQMPDLKDISDNYQNGPREVKIKLREKAYALGLRLQDVIGQVRQGFFGQEAQRLQRGLDEVKIWVRYDLADRANMAKLENMRIRTSAGEFPLSELAEVSIERGLVAINHLDGKREVRIEAEMNNPNASSTELLEEVRASIMPKILSRYPTVGVSYEGQSKETLKTAKSASKIIPIILILMFAIIVWTFRSMWQAVVLFLTIPFGFIGVTWGHFAHGQAISMLSFFGVIALIGVMVNDGLVFVTRFNELMKEGIPFKEALYKTGLSRFRAIALTSVTTIAGLAPLLLEKSFQAQFLIPMAIAIAYGLLIATLVTLIILPVFLVMLNRARVYLIWFWTGHKPTAESVEPAVIEIQFENQMLPKP
jgi:multidrug efflux pump subunit AcrB